MSIWTRAPTWLRAMMFVTVLLAARAAAAWLLGWDLVRGRRTRLRCAGEAVADAAETGADEAEARAGELGEDLDPARADDDARRCAGLVALAEREAGERYDRHDGLRGLDPFGGE